MEVGICFSNDVDTNTIANIVSKGENVGEHFTFYHVFKNFTSMLSVLLKKNQVI